MEAPTHGLLEQLNDHFDGGYMLNKEILWNMEKQSKFGRGQGNKDPLGPPWERPQVYLFQVHSNTLKCS